MISKTKIMAMLSEEGRKLKDLLSNNVREDSVCDSEMKIRS